MKNYRLVLSKSTLLSGTPVIQTQWNDKFLAFLNNVIYGLSNYNMFDEQISRIRGQLLLLIEIVSTVDNN